MEQFSLSFLPERRIYSLRELSDGIRSALDRSFANIWISGEISGVRVVSSGHCYFSLKDADAQIKCVCWKLTYWRLKFKPIDGVQVLIRGRVDIYEQRSEYQFVVEAIEPQGFGALQLAFEELKRKLLSEGLFDSARKRPLPQFPRRIGIISSPSGAVIRDFVQILSRRFPGLHIRLFPAKVQGPGSAEEVCRGLDYFGHSDWAEVVVVARGGGSLEDLWTFNEESVARAIAASPVPVVSAIGHETDVTIADFVADLRAPTPSAAAEMIVCTRQELLDRIDGARARSVRSIQFRLSVLTRRLQEQAIGRAQSLLQRSLSRRSQRLDDADDRLQDGIRDALARRERRRKLLEDRLLYFDLRPRLRRDRERLNSGSFRLVAAIRQDLNTRGRRFETLTARLSQLNPRLVLSRGYAIVLNDAGAIVRAAEDAVPGSAVRILLEKDALTAQITQN